MIIAGKERVVKKIKFDILWSETFYSCTSRTVNGWCIGDVSGLGIYRSKNTLNSWHVTHLASGKRIDRFGFLTRKDAIVYVLRLKEVPWELNSDDVVEWLSSHEHLRKIVIQSRDRAL
ncbi:hypothetical protein LCGC14_0810980 [marine sediment metagenome]|uniref:Uncharacterized protein n=1 Tax=marine sediment metagenome TaxID=412755 RepID=A0A0F9Q6W0_9ZZZZ